MQPSLAMTLMLTSQRSLSDLSFNSVSLNNLYGCPAFMIIAINGHLINYIRRARSNFFSVSELFDGIPYLIL